MLYHENSVHTLISNISNKNISALLYTGNNIGLALIISDQIKKQLKFDEFIVIDLENDDKDDDILILNQLLSSNSLFTGTRLLKIHGIKDKNKNLVSKILADISNIDGLFIMLYSQGYDNKNIRDIFEKNPTLGLIKCNDDDYKSLPKILNDFCQNNDLNIISDLKDLIINRMNSQDRLNIINELEKIKLYLSANKNYTKDDICNLITNDEEMDLFALSDAIINRDKVRIFKELSNKDKDVSMIQICRIVLYSIQNIKKMKSQIHKDKIPIEDVLKYNRIHFSRNHIVRQHLKLTESQLIDVENLVYDTEISAKQYGEGISNYYMQWKLLSQDLS